MFSFGGGAASQLLLRKELVWKRHWLRDDEYNRVWQLSKLSLGIQQIAQVMIFGRRLGGKKGIAVAVSAFLLPAVLLTVILSIVLVAVIGERPVVDGLRVVIPLTGGMTMATALQMWNPKTPRSVRQSLRIVGQGLIVLVCALLVGVIRVPVPLVMLAAILGGALLPL